MTNDTQRYRLKQGIEQIHAPDLTLHRGETVELSEDEAQAINDNPRRDGDVIEPAGGSSGDGGDE